MKQNSSQYQLFVSNKCCCCDKVLEQIAKEKISVLTINVDDGEVLLPFSLTILPALVKGEKLIGYGVDDIIKHLKRA